MQDNPAHSHSHRSYVRQFSRHAIDKRIRVVDHKSGVAIRGRCTSLSEGGFAAVLAGELPELEMVTIEFQHAMGQELRLIARVRHHKGFNYGFEFVALRPELKQALTELLEEDFSDGNN